MEESALIYTIAITALILSFLPVVGIWAYSTRKRWHFRKFGMYVQFYVYAVALVIYWLAGIRGWMLLAGMGVALALGLLTYFAYAYLLDIVRPTPGRRRPKA